MDLDKIVYEVREKLEAISDDRRIDKRFIMQGVDSFRADLLRKMLSRKPGFSTVGYEQQHNLTVELVDRSLISMPIECNVLRSVEPIPSLIYTQPGSNWFRVDTIDVLKDTIETITEQRAQTMSFEFPAAYAFLRADKYIYFISNDNYELKYAIVMGVFESPLEVDPDLTSYPLPASDWATIKPNVLDYLTSKLREDPLNNSEPDEQQATTRNPRNSQ